MRNPNAYRYGLFPPMTKVAAACGMALTIVVLGACSADGIKRVAYESVQGAGEEQCRKTQSPNCPAHPGYAEYERNRAALSTAEN
jgi:hypothetical protein